MTNSTTTSFTRIQIKSRTTKAAIADATASAIDDARVRNTIVLDGAARDAEQTLAGKASKADLVAAYNALADAIEAHEAEAETKADLEQLDRNLGLPVGTNEEVSDEQRARDYPLTEADPVAELIEDLGDDLGDTSAEARTETAEGETLSVDGFLLSLSKAPAPKAKKAGGSRKGPKLVIEGPTNLYGEGQTTGPVSITLNPDGSAIFNGETFPNLTKAAKAAGLGYTAKSGKFYCRPFNHMTVLWDTERNAIATPESDGEKVKRVSALVVRDDRYGDDARASARGERKARASRGRNPIESISKQIERERARVAKSIAKIEELEAKLEAALASTTEES